MERLFRLAVIVSVACLSVWFLTPTINWYFLTPEDKKEIVNQPLELIGSWSSEKAAHDVDELVMLARQDSSQVLPSHLNYFTTLAKKDYRQKKQALPSTWTVNDVVSHMSGQQSAQQFARSYYADPIKKAKEQKNRAIKLGLDLAGGLSVTMQADFSNLEKRLGRLPTEQEKTDNMNAAIEILSSRANQFGTSEPYIRRLGEDQILVELAGEKDPDAVNRLILGRGSLTFHIVNEELTQKFMEYVASHPDVSIDAQGRPINAPDVIPAGYIVRSEYKKDDYGKDVFVKYWVLNETVGLDGIHIEQAQTSFSNTNEPQVSFSLDSEGATIFGKLTNANTNKGLAVLMDNRVKSVANIREAITGGQVSVTGFNTKEANNLATILRTANLPIELDVVNMSKVGPSLGEETIKAGLQAMLWGLLAVYLFTLLYYTGAGVIACTTLTLNMLLTLGLLSFLGFTLTLTSMAGLVLNIGMAVDANVIIFERIRDELRWGKSRRNAVEAGFRKAFWTIMDSNLTTFFATLFLSALGSGPVKGFAITLSIGIVSTLFTGIYASHVLFDIGTENLRRQKLAIGFGVKKA